MRHIRERLQFQSEIGTALVLRCSHATIENDGVVLDAGEHGRGLACVASGTELLKRHDQAPERLVQLFDAGTYHALRDAQSDGVASGFGLLGGRSALAWAQDSNYKGGSLGVVGGELIARTIEMADHSRVPVIGLVASGGARLQDGAGALAAYASIFRTQSLATVPQLSVICGACAGGGAYSPALGHLVITLKEARLFLTGPRVLAQVTRQEVSAEELGGTRVHSRNGVAHIDVSDMATAVSVVRAALSYLPPAIGEPPPRACPLPPGPGAPDAVLPGTTRQVYDVRDVISRLVDGGDLLELSPRWARNLVVGLARLDGWPIGVIANQPRWLGGTLDVSASEKGSWFVDLCDRFGLPLAVLVDTPGFLPGTDQERGGVIRHGAGLVRSFARATVPRATVTIRAAYGGAHIAMNSRGLGATASLAWPTARIGIMGGRQAVEVIYRRRIAAGEGADQLAADYESDQLTAERALAAGAIDEIVHPASTRERLIAALTSSSPWVSTEPRRRPAQKEPIQL